MYANIFMKKFPFLKHYYCFRNLHISHPRYAIYNSILDTIGRTPVVKMNEVLSDSAKKRGIQLYGKLEYFNPMGSIKDRLAIGIIELAEKEGQLKPGMTVVESTSGNTGIGLAMVCAKKGYRFVAVMGEQFSLERRRIMRALGAKVIITPKELGGAGMALKAQELSECHGWFSARQFETKANIAYHANTTGPEIIRDFAGKRLDYWVTGYGTGGTFAGAGKVIKCARPELQICLVEPDVARLVHSGIKQSRNQDGTPIEPHPAFNIHMIQGWTPNFIPAVCEEGLNLHLNNQNLSVSLDDALETAHVLAKSEGVFTGISGGATVAAGKKIADKAPDNSVILTMLPDTQERYQSSILFESIPYEMDNEELEILKSTPLGHS